MLIIDCDTHFGVHASSPEDASVERLISIEKSESVNYVLAYCLAGRTYDARTGNDAAMDASRRHPEVLPVATVDPRMCYGIEEEIRRVAELGFVALRVFPELQGWSLDSVLLSQVITACDKHALPLLISAESPGKASKIVQMAAGTSVPIVLLSANYGVQAEVLTAAGGRDNTYICTRFFCTPDAYEEAARRLGANRLVNGTDAPASGIRESISTVLRSRLSEEDKAGVLGSNLGRIIAGQLEKLGKNLTDSSGLVEFDRKRVKTPIIDVHGHLGPWPFPMNNCSAEGLVELMRRRGIEKSVVSSTNAIVNDFVQGNAELDRALDEVEEIYGYVTVNPNDIERSLQEMRKYLGKPKWVGLKLHPSYTRQPIDGDANRALTQVAACSPVPYLIHTMGAGEPSKIRKLAQEFPEMPIIMAHGGAAAWREAVEVIKDTKNTYIEFCTSTCQFGKVRQAIDEIGTDRMLFGTDSGLFDPAYNLGTYESADLSIEEQEAIMHVNARRLFGFAQQPVGAL